MLFSDCKMMGKVEKTEVFPIDVVQVPTGRPLPCILYIHFRINNRFVPFRSKGLTLTPQDLLHLSRRKIFSFYILNKDSDKFWQFLKGKTEKSEPKIKPKKAKVKTSDTAITSNDFNETSVAERESVVSVDNDAIEKDEITIETSSNKIKPDKSILALARPETEESTSVVATDSSSLSFNPHVAADALVELEEDKKEKALKIVNDILSDLAVDDRFVQLLETQVNEHSVTVALYSVVFAIGLGKNNKQALYELAVAGLVHEVGMTQIMPNIIAIPETKRTPKMQAHYLKHNEITLDLLGELGHLASAQVQAVLKFKHVRFGDNSEVDEMAQILNMADTLHLIRSGRFDSQKRSLKDSVFLFYSLEQDANSKPWMNPKVSEAIIRWLMSVPGHEALERSMGIVKSSVKSFLRTT